MSENEKQEIKESDSREKRKIGVYICHCGGNISDYVDVDRVKQEIEDDEEVVVSKTSIFTCSDAFQNEMMDDIKKHNLDGMVVASCSPKLHLETFRGVANRSDLNPFQYCHANIREQCSWAHSDNKVGATKKAASLVKGTLEKVKYTEALETIQVQAEKKCLVIGAGIAGLRAAIEMADMGVEVILIEKEPFVGGKVARLGKMYPHGKTGEEVITLLTNEIEKRNNIHLYTNTEIIKKSGYIGNFEITLKQKPRYVTQLCENFPSAIQACPVEISDEHTYGLTKRKALYTSYKKAYPKIPTIDIQNCTRCGECIKICPEAINLDQKEKEIAIKVGAIVTATGFENYTPKENEFGYGLDGVITLAQFEKMISLAKCDSIHFKGKPVKTVSFIYCVGSRQPKKQENANTYCSRYCCNAAVNSALNAMNTFKGIQTFHLYKDIRTYGKFELQYEEVSNKGAVFIRFPEKKLPEVEQKNGQLTIKTLDLLTGREEIEIESDLVVLVTGMVPSENERLTSQLKLQVGSDKFYNEIHPKLRPVETIIDGVYLGGCCQGPKNSSESIMTSLSAVSKAAALLIKGYVSLPPFIAFVREMKCTWCGKCQAACPYLAIEKTEDNGKEIAKITDVLCKGCGACIPVCPTDAMQMKNCTDEQVMSTIEAFAKEVVYG